MIEGFKPSVPPVSTLLYGVLGFTAAQGMAQKLPLLLAGKLVGGQIGDAALDVILFSFAGFSLAKSFGLIGKVDYSALDGYDVDSFAREASEWALAGEVPSQGRSKDGKYEVATFAGGCFW